MASFYEQKPYRNFLEKVVHSTVQFNLRPQRHWKRRISKRGLASAPRGSLARTARVSAKRKEEGGLPARFRTMVGWCATMLIILTLLQPHKNCASIIFLKRGQPTLMRRSSLQWIFMMHFERKVAEFAPSKTLQKAIDRIWSLFEFGGFACACVWSLIRGL